jgi:PAS domain S-box-containing protein
MEPISILVVDDTPQNLVSLEAILEEPGLRVVGVTSARDALRQLLQEEFAAILLDVHMPDLDGFETASLIRARPLSKHTPILFMTAYAVEHQIQKAYALGAVDYMPTPVQPEILRTKVAVFVELYRKRLEVRRQAELLRDAEAALREQMQHALRESEDRFQVLCTAAPVAILQLDPQGRCVYASPVWEAVTGRPPGAAAGLGWADVISDGRSAETLASWHEAVGKREQWSCESKFTWQGAPRWVHVRTSHILDERHEAVGHVGTVEDITSRKLVESRLREADRKKDEFLAMLAHELRNPLAAIGSAAMVARTPHLERERDWSLAVIGRQVRHLEKLLDDLMDVSRITLGKIELRKERLGLAAVLARATDAIQAMTAERQQQILMTPPDAAVTVDVDPTRIEQVFVNLLGNASKYSPDGRTIWVETEVRPGWVDVRVRDEGIGLTPDLVERVFDLFAQGTNGLDRANGGLGIGLSLAQRLTDLHGGQIRAESEGIGMGAQFTVSLPLAETEPVEADGGAEPVRSAAPVARTVLLVDDNEDATRALALLLVHGGFSVVTAHDGAEALTRAADTDPDIVLLDLGLPVIDGYRVAESLRARTDRDRVLLIAISGYGQPNDRARSKEAGFDYHLVKPIDCGALLDLLRQHAPMGRVAKRTDAPGANSAYS